MGGSRKRRSDSGAWLVTNEEVLPDLQRPAWKGSPAPERAAWVEKPLRDGWVAQYRLVPVDGAPVVAEVRVLFRDSARPLPTSGLARLLKHEVTVGAVLTQSRKLFKQLHTRLGDAIWDRVTGLGKFGFTASSLRPGKRGHADTFFAPLAIEYGTLHAQGVKNPTTVLAEKYGVPLPTMRGWIGQCRKRGLLTEVAGKSGRAGGEATPRALALAGGTPQRSVAPSEAGWEAYRDVIEAGGEEGDARAAYLRAKLLEETADLPEGRWEPSTAEKGPPPRWCARCDGSIELKRGKCPKCGWKPGRSG
jgi:hypothetical protein